jgi:ribosomal RNA-processing protein 9
VEIFDLFFFTAGTTTTVHTQTTGLPSRKTTGKNNNNNSSNHSNRMVDSFFVDPSKKRRNNRDNRQTSTVRSNQKKQDSTYKRPKTQKQIARVNREDAAAEAAENRPEFEGSAGDEDLDDDIDEEEVDSDVFADIDDEKDEVSDVNEDDEEEDFKNENEADKRRRLAKKYLDELKASLGGSGGADDDEEGSGNFAFDAKDLDDEIIRSRLKKDVAEQKGWVYKYYSKQLGDILKRKITRVHNNCLTTVSVSHPYLFTASKDIEISKWDIRDPLKNPKLLKTVKGGMDKYDLSKEHAENGHFDQIFTSAVSPDGKYLVTGGKDGRIIVWSTNSLACIRVLETKNRKGEVLSMAFRRNSDQLYVACADLKVRTYSINQLAQLETLYGHQDLVVDIAALGLERCVTVGSRDRTALLWKIADETRLTFRGGDSHDKYKDPAAAAEPIFFEGSIDCVSMIDDSHFITGSDNGNLSLWSLNKKKPLFTNRISHGIQPALESYVASAEVDNEKGLQQVPPPQPFWITSVHAIPYADVFITGSWDGSLRVWKLDEQLRGFTLLKELPVNGIVTKITSLEDEEAGQVRIYATVSKEHKFSRCIKGLKGARNALFTCVIKLD